MRECAPDYPGHDINFKGVYNVLVSIKQKSNIFIFTFLTVNLRSHKVPSG